MQALARRLRAGTVWVNTWQAMDPAVPFGGWGLSGYGRESGTEQLDAYLESGDRQGHRKNFGATLRTRPGSIFEI